MKNASWPTIGPVLTGAALIVIGIILLLAGGPPPVYAQPTELFAIDADISDGLNTGGPSPTIGPIDTCGTIPGGLGGTLDIDIVLDAVPLVDGIAADAWILNFDKNSLWVTASNRGPAPTLVGPKLLFEDPDSMVLDVMSESTSSDGTWSVGGTDFKMPKIISPPPFVGGDMASSETGVGTIGRARLTAKVAGPVEVPITLTSRKVGNNAGQEITAKFAVQNATIAIGCDCGYCGDNLLPPTANDVDIGTIPQDSIGGGGWKPVVSDPDTSPLLLTCSIVGGSTLGGLSVGTSVKGGPVTVKRDCSSGTYLPPAGFTGNDSFQYIANDGDFDSNAATVKVVVATDADGDKVLDDLCPETQAGAYVDAKGCSEAQVDWDKDGICDPGAVSTGPSPGCTGSDNCVYNYNPGQSDADGDGEGDACEGGGRTDGGGGTPTPTPTPAATPTPTGTPLVLGEVEQLTSAPQAASQVPATGFGPFSSGANWTAVGLTAVGLLLVLGGLASPFAYRAIRRRSL